MKLGVAGLLGRGTYEEVHRVREMGFDAASWHLPDFATAVDRDALSQVRETLDDEELELCQLLPPDYPALVHPDEAVRRAGVEALGVVIAAAEVLGAGNVYVRPGSRNSAGPWTPHPENHRAETLEWLVDSLRHLVPIAEKAGIPLALEGHVVSPLHSPRVIRDVLDAVGSPLLRFNADPVNLISNLDQAFDPSPLVHELFDLLGDAIVCAHAKDVTVGNSLVLHIDECVPGQGYLDQELFLRRFEAVCPRGIVLIEHLPADRVPEARRALLEFAARGGLTFGSG